MGKHLCVEYGDVQCCTLYTSVCCISGECLFSILIFLGLKSYIKSVKYQKLILLRSTYCDNSKNESEIVPVSALPRLSEHTCRKSAQGRLVVVYFVL